MARVILPSVWMISTSLKGVNEVFANPLTWIPQVFHWENYLEVWQEAHFARDPLNSSVVTVVVTMVPVDFLYADGFRLRPDEFQRQEFYVRLLFEHDKDLDPGDPGAVVPGPHAVALAGPLSGKDRAIYCSCLRRVHDTASFHCHST